MKREDLTGQKFNRYTFLKYDCSDKHGQARWLCRCDCGTEKVVSANCVKQGKTKSCGCIPKKHKDYVGQKYKRLTLIQYEYSRKWDSYWLCRCDCGVEKILNIDDVKYGGTTSCGCARSEHKDLTGQKFGRYTFVEHKHGQYWLCKCDCGTEKIVHAGSVKIGHTTSCGCYQKECFKKRNGKNHPNYRHDLTKEERELGEENRKIAPKHRQWRKKVFERDKYICQCCGERSKNLQAHHIYSWNSHKKLRYVTSNGITLCDKCHKMFHKEFGYGNNTQKQLTKFLSRSILGDKNPKIYPTNQSSPITKQGQISSNQ